MRFIPVTAVAALSLLGSATLIAQSTPSQPGTPDPAKITGGTYEVDGNHSQVLFSYNHFGFSENVGVIAGPTGSLSLDPKNPAAASVSVEFPIANIQTGIPVFNEHLQAANWFDAAKFPTATFKSTKVTVNGTSADIAGDLTIRGVTRPVVLKATFVGAGIQPMNKKENVGFAATATVRRSDFNLGGAVPLVSDAVDLKIVAAFQK